MEKILIVEDDVGISSFVNDFAIVWFLYISLISNFSTAIISFSFIILFVSYLGIGSCFYYPTPHSK